jgi:hypothetical protein
MVNSTTGSDSPRDTHQGGAPPGACAIAGTVIDGPAADTAIMTRSDTVMQEAAVQTSPRVARAPLMFLKITVVTPQVVRLGRGGWRHVDAHIGPADGTTVSDGTFMTG